MKSIDRVGEGKCRGRIVSRERRGGQIKIQNYHDQSLHPSQWEQRGCECVHNMLR